MHMPLNSQSYHFMDKYSEVHWAKKYEILYVCITCSCNTIQWTNTHTNVSPNILWTSNSGREFEYYDCRRNLSMWLGSHFKDESNAGEHVSYEKHEEESFQVFEAERLNAQVIYLDEFNICNAKLLSEYVLFQNYKHLVPAQHPLSWRRIRIISIKKP